MVEKKGFLVTAAIIDIVVGFLLMSIGAYTLSTIRGNYTNNFVISFYFIVFGVLTIVDSIVNVSVVTENLPFLRSWLGKGLWFLFLGSIAFGNRYLYEIYGALVIVVIGIFYIVASFFTLPRPLPLRDLKANAPSGYKAIN